MRYEPGLDGIRALAVIAVLAFHNEFDWAQGGFLGISLFFTLSGFLITSILLRGVDAHATVDLRGFWARRGRRLLPAAFATLAGVVVFASTIATRSQLADLDGAVVACIVQVVNWFFVFTDQSYVALFSAPSPVQHFWSLSIEAQFYALMPLVLLALVRRGTSRRVMGAVFAAGAVASTAWMVVLFESGTGIDRLYYGTDTRLAELLVGCCLAVVLHARPALVHTTHRGPLAVATTLALAATVWAWTALSLDDAVLYRGGFLGGAVLAAVLIFGVLAGSRPVAPLFANPPMRAIGIVSYGLYLFHWPVFLWLTPSRTDLGPWPLFALRVGVTAVFATLSYHLLERPFRTQTARVRGLRLRPLAAATALVVIGATFVVAQRDVPSEFAGLGAATTRPVVEVDEVRVLVITGPDEQATADELAARAAERTGVRVQVADPVRCDEPDCAALARAWQRAVDTFDPDAVLFHLNDWSGTPIATLCGCADLEEQTAWAARVLGDAFGVLTKRGAPVLWSQREVDLAAALRRERDPFYLAMGRLIRTRADVVDLQAPGQDADGLLTDATTYRRRRAGDATRVLVVGDSSAKSLGYGLERWGREHGNVVWNTATEGCGIARHGSIVDATRGERAITRRCRAVWDEWREQVRSFRPDIVVVLSQLFDLAPRRLDGWPEYRVPGDRAFDDYLVREYEQAYDVLGAEGARVVWLTAPCARVVFGSTEGLASRTLAVERVRHVNDVVLRRVVEQRPKLRVFDLFGVLCPDGKFTNELDGVQNLRPDGFHFGPDGSMWFAERYGADLLDTARR